MTEILLTKPVRDIETGKGGVDAPKTSVRYQALDGLRGLAALLVVFYHIEFQSAHWPNHLTNNNFTRHGYLAVDLFFILSGLVISSNYSARITCFLEVKEFLFLRFFRLYPLHIAILVALVFLECGKLVENYFALSTPSLQPPYTGDRSLGALATSILLINGWHVSDVAAWNGPSWSISCELAAYLLFVALALTGLINKRSFFIFGLVAAAMSYPMLAFAYGTLDLTANWGIVRCLAGFFLGMLLYEFGRPSRSLLPPLPPTMFDTAEIIAALAVIAAIALSSGPFIILVVPAFVALIALLKSDRGPVAFLLNTRPLQFLGRVSYSIYMVHVLILLGMVIVLDRLVPSIFHRRILNYWIGDVLVIMAIMVVVGAATVTYRYIEEPGRLFGRRRFTRSGNRA